MSKSQEGMGVPVSHPALFFVAEAEIKEDISLFRSSKLNEQSVDSNCSKPNQTNQRGKNWRCPSTGQI